jgi:hypothetical protein
MLFVQWRCLLLARLNMNVISVFYSFLSARMGSMRAARMAGNTDAALAMKASAATENAITDGSPRDVS